MEKPIAEHADAPPEQSKKAVSLFIFFFQSAALAALFPIVLLCSGGNTRRLSLLLCSYFYSAVFVLSAATRKGRARLFYAPFLAFVVDAFMSRAAGMVIIYLDSVWIAGVFGRTLAEHRASGKAAATAQEAWKKLACELGSIVFLALVYSTAAICPLSMAAGCSLEFALVLTMVILFLGPVAIRVVLGKHRTSSENAADEDAQGKLAGELGFIIFLAFVLSACGMCPLCIVIKAAPGCLSPLEFVLSFLPMVLCSCVPVVIIYTLRGRGRIVTFLGLVECYTGNALASWYIWSFCLFTFSFFVARKAEAVVAVLWICVLGLAVLLGYFLRLHAFGARSKSKMVAPPADEEQAGADRGNIQQTVTCSGRTAIAGKQTDGPN